MRMPVLSFDSTPTIVIGLALLGLAGMGGEAWAQSSPCAETTCGNVTHASPTVIVGSPSGQARPFPITVYPNLNNGMFQELWIGFGDNHGNCNPPQPYGVSGGDLECNEDACPLVLPWAYQEALSTSTTFYPRFGGNLSASQSVCIQIEITCEPGSKIYYVGSDGSVEARSTDFDNDGDTDQIDKIRIGQELASPSGIYQKFNLNTDDASNTSFDGADYLVIVDEMLREIADPPVLYRCGSNTDPDVPVVPSGQTWDERFADDLSAPQATIMQVSAISGCNRTIRWASPGDDYYNNQKLGVPEEYEIRYSSSPITSENFASAELYPTPPTPALAGILQSITADVIALNARYWAMRTKDWAGNWSTISTLDVSPVTITDVTACSVSKNCVLIGWTGPSNGNFYDVARISTSPISECNVGSASSGGAVPTPVNAGGHNEMFIDGLSANTTYYVALRAKPNFTDQYSYISNVVQFTTPGTGPSCRDNVTCNPSPQIFRPVDIPSTLELSPPHPNPTDEQTSFMFSIPQEHDGGALRLSVFDLAGRRVAVLYEGLATVGRHVVSWNLKGEGDAPVRSGVYFARLQVGSHQLKQRLVIP